MVNRVDDTMPEYVSKNFIQLEAESRSTTGSYTPSACIALWNAPRCIATQCLQRSHENTQTE